MRIILLLATALGAAAIAAEAPARSIGVFVGKGSAAPAASGGHHAGAGGRGYFRPGMNRGDRRHGRFGRHGRHEFHPYGAGGIAGPYDWVDPYGNGFFAGRGGGIRVRGNRPYYDYDRSYPYQWASAAGGREDGEEEEERAAERRPSCTFENGVRVCRGW